MNTRMIVSGLAVLISACASSDIPERAILSTKSGMTVYTFDKDGGGKSNCDRPCAAVWPPVKPSDVSGEGFTSITRGDGSLQAAYEGAPIYLFAADEKAGDAKGDNIEGVWHVVPLASGIERPKRGSSGGYGGYGGYSGYGY